MTLTNQIDSYNSTLREVRLRRKNDKFIVEKIRDAKIRLSLLKAFYKNQSDKVAPDDAIMNILGISGKSAKEVNTIETAASGKKPLEQNFESAELENNGEEGSEVKLSTGTPIEFNWSIDSKKPESISETKIVAADVFEEKEEDAVMKEDEIVQQVFHTVNAEKEKDMKEFGTFNGETDNAVDIQNIEAEQANDSDTDQNVTLEKKSEDTEVDVIEGETQKELPDVNYCESDKGEKEIEDQKIIEKYKIDENTYDLRSANDNELLDLINSLTDTDEIYVKTPPKEMVQNDTVSPVFESEKEDKEFIQDMKTEKETNNNIQVIDTEEIGECTLPDCPPPTMEDYLEPIEDDVIVDNYDSIENSDLEPVTETFVEEVRRMSASIDLSKYTNMVNTATIIPNYNMEKKILELNFSDLRDYPIFLFFMNELKENKCRLFRKAKNPRSIFMTVTNEIEGIKENYTFEFTDCKLVSLHDSSYTPLYKNSIWLDDDKTHYFLAKFKYKKLIIT